MRSDTDTGRNYSLTAGKTASRIFGLDISINVTINNADHKYFDNDDAGHDKIMSYDGVHKI